MHQHWSHGHYETKKQEKEDSKGDKRAREQEQGEEEENDDEDDVNVDLHAFRVAYVTLKLQQHGNLRLKHVPRLLEMARIPYEKSR